MKQFLRISFTPENQFYEKQGKKSWKRRKIMAIFRRLLFLCQI